MAWEMGFSEVGSGSMYEWMWSGLGFSRSFGFSKRLVWNMGEMEGFDEF